jgi:hypothetical protein
MPLDWNFWCEKASLEHLDHRALGIGKDQHVLDRRLGIGAALG